MRKAWTLFNVEKAGVWGGGEKRPNASPALPARLVFQKEPYDTLWC